MKIYVILSLLFNLIICFYILQYEWLLAYGITRCSWSLVIIYEIIFSDFHKINKNKKFYILYWLRIMLFYREYIIYLTIKNQLHDIKNGDNKEISLKFDSEKIPPNWYDRTVDFIVDNFSNLKKWVPRELE